MVQVTAAAIPVVEAEPAAAQTDAPAPAPAAESPKTVKVVFCRHGESEWNALNQFCGWFDAALSDDGKAEAKAGVYNYAIGSSTFSANCATVHRLVAPVHCPALPVHWMHLVQHILFCRHCCSLMLTLRSILIHRRAFIRRGCIEGARLHV